MEAITHAVAISEGLSGTSSKRFPLAQALIAAYIPCMTYLVQHRYILGFAPPLKPGRYTATSDWYEVDRSPRIGKTCTAFIQHAKQAGRLVRTTYDSFPMEG